MRCGKLIKRVLGAILVIVLALGLFIACAFGYCQFMHWYRHQAVYEVVVSSDSVLMDGVAVQVGSWGSLEDGMDGVKSMREVLRADSDIRKSVLRFKMTPDLPLKDFVRVGWEAHEFCRVREMEIACGEVSVPMNWACTECQRAGEGRLICLTDDKLVVYESDEAFFDEDRMAQYSHRSIDPGSVDEGALRSLLTSGRGGEEQLLSPAENVGGVGLCYGFVNSDKKTGRSFPWRFLFDDGHCLKEVVPIFQGH